ncbi:MAG: D-3-phosphoglycerate dehydrogenase [Acidimicrobiales bacterium]|jgi:D-3-phosphoglycerate dehydrogenase
MRVLFADPIDESRLGRLRSAGHDCVVENLTAAELPGEISGFDTLVVRSTKVTSDTIAAADRLELIVRAGAGIDNIDRASASAAGIYLCNVPGRNAVAVAELTLGLLLAVDRHIPDGVADLRASRWDKTRYGSADGLSGKHLAIVGLGDVGLAVAERAKAFGMTIGVIRKDERSPAIKAKIRGIGIRLADDLDSLLAEADVVSLHVPKSPDTTGLVSRKFLAAMPDGAIVLNTSRGDVINEAALLDALNTRGFRAGLDVFADEPTTPTGPWTSPLASHPSVVGSHHIGASTRQAQASVADGVVEVIEAFIAGDPPNCLNIVQNPTDARCLSIRHLDRVGVLAQILNVLGRSGLNVQQMQNQVFEGGNAAVATINLHGEISRALLDQLQAIDEVISAIETGETS